MQDYFVKTVKFESGERYPLLIEKKSGVPDYWVTLFATKTIRNKSNAVTTIELALRHLLIMKLYFENQKVCIDLEKRVSEGKLLAEYEITHLAMLCKMQATSIRKWLEEYGADQNSLPTSREKVRSSLPISQYGRVDSQTAAHRMRTILKYIIWYANRHISVLNYNDPIKRELEKSRDYFKDLFTELIPKAYAKNSLNGPQGLDENAQSRLNEIINRNSNRNPWKSDFARMRNEVIVRMLITFGSRGGELLGIKLEDISVSKSELTIVRRQDDPDETRTDAPVQKTRSRRIPIPDALLELIKVYIFDFRSKTRNAHRHKYLFVAANTGEPLSKPALQKIFNDLKASDPALSNLTPHILRHTWNDNFSVLMDAKGEDEEAEKMMRSYLMGWKPTSDTAATYTRRYVRKKANNAILELNSELERTTGGDDG